MRVALCFWGLCRSTHIVLNSIQQNIFDTLTLAGIEYDTYIHTFVFRRPYTNVRAGEVDIELPLDSWKLVYPHESIIEDQDEVDTRLNLLSYRNRGNPWDDSIHPTAWSTFDNHIRSLYSLFRVSELRARSRNQVDAVIFLRPDVRYCTPFPVHLLNTVSRSTVIIPDFHLHQGVNDRFAICHPATASIYGNRFTHALEYSKHFPLHSETFLKWILEKHSLHIYTIPFVFQRVRATGETAPADVDLTTHIARHRIQMKQQRS